MRYVNTEQENYTLYRVKIKNLYGYFVNELSPWNSHCLPKDTRHKQFSGASLQVCFYTVKNISILNLHIDQLLSAVIL